MNDVWSKIQRGEEGFLVWEQNLLDSLLCSVNEVSISHQEDSWDFSLLSRNLVKSDLFTPYMEFDQVGVGLSRV